VYVPAACAAPTFKVPPTVTVAVPPAIIPVELGVLVNEPKVMVLLTAYVSVMVPGKVIANVLVPKPVTVNEAADTVPVTAGSVTPPAGVRTPPGLRTTVPAIVGLTAKLPKFRSAVFAMAIGVMMVALEAAVAETCALEVTAKPAIAIKRITNFFIFVDFCVEFIFTLF